MIYKPEKFLKARGNRKPSVVAHEMAKILDRPVTPRTILNWERGVCNPTEELFKAYCQVTKRQTRFFI